MQPGVHPNRSRQRLDDVRQVPENPVIKPKNSPQSGGASLTVQ